MSKTYFGIDNGVTGTIAILKPNETIFVKTPVKEQLSYTKVKKNITRIDVPALTKLLFEALPDDPQEGCFALIERPMVMPGRFVATTSALRACEATLIVIESLKIPYQYIDSKEWQKALLPSGLRGPALKKASKEIGKRLFPSIELKHEDCDGLLIAEYARRKQL
jgi:hypothetical protein